MSISSPDRVVYPDAGVTKLQLAEFYESIADWILPHVENRPLSLVRCPQGRSKACFYQKHVSGTFPDAVREIAIEEKSKTGHCPYVVDVAGVAALVQMGVLEVHPWGARIDKLERPDLLVFDLDPAEDVKFSRVCDGAIEIRDFLAELGLESFVRTSGGKGLHVVVPVQRRTDWDDFKAFAKGTADSLVRRSPRDYIATASKSKRKGKVFIDWLRNGRGATSIVSYGARARVGAPVATPLRWDELTASLRPDAWTVLNLRNRLDSLKADPWEGFFDARQSITKAMQQQVNE